MVTPSAKFVILLQGDFVAGQAQALLTRLMRQLCDPFEVDSVRLQISASVGVTRYPQPDAIDPDQLICQADQATYQAKLFGRNRICVFN